MKFCIHQWLKKKVFIVCQVKCTVYLSLIEYIWPLSPDVYMLHLSMAFNSLWHIIPCNAWHKYINDDENKWHIGWNVKRSRVQVIRCHEDTNIEEYSGYWTDCLRILLTMKHWSYLWFYLIMHSQWCNLQWCTKKGRNIIETKTTMNYITMVIWFGQN